MEKWHKIAVFAVGLIGLISYIYGTARKVVESKEEPPVRRREKGFGYQLIFLAAIIVAMFVVPKLIADLVTFLFPEPEKTSFKIIFNFIRTLIYVGERYFGNKSYFFEGRGLMLLEWLFILAPYIIGFTIWSIRIIFRRERI
ncbi:MAG: hypothetical protein QME75_00880 [Deltaproteobacteria bacterium]|nr:hypothetical protein [Deltaproteobacteria bacterium]